MRLWRIQLILSKCSEKSSSLPNINHISNVLNHIQISEPNHTFEITTVNFDQRSSPFLVIRIVHQLVIYEADVCLNVQRVLRNDLYVDDVATCAECIKNDLKFQQNVKKFQKWRVWTTKIVQWLDKGIGSLTHRTPTIPTCNQHGRPIMTY